MFKISSTQKAYLAGFIDGDGSIYVRLKPNISYRYGFQISPYIVLFQSSKDEKLFKEVYSLINFGYLRKRKDGILEYTIGKVEDIKNFLEMIGPYLILKRKQAILMLKILEKKELVKSESDFEKLMNLIDKFRDLNYSKKRKKHKLTP
ncbi:MAG: LAGLIDADG family homing endonuclease [Candidatus Cloacimonetes bacterium]|nr:LAGLIDADG family homing endonuclease [Candidatus Cloacimonadota bacterium]